MKLRPTPALVVAVLALVVALAGTSYAAVQIGSAQIKNNSVKGKDVKDSNLTGKDVKDASLAGADLQDGSVTGADVTDKSLSSADVDRSCATTDVAVMGVCIDKASTGPSSFTTALADCDTKGGRLMTYLEFRVFTNKPGAIWADGNVSNYEFIDLHTISGAVITPNAVSFGGGAFGDASGQNFWHHCVTYP